MQPCGTALVRGTTRSLKLGVNFSRTTSSHHIHNLDELHALIEAHGAWGLSLHEFQQRAGYRKEGNAEYITTFSWGYSGTTLQEMWNLVQYIRKHYGSAR